MLIRYLLSTLAPMALGICAYAVPVMNTVEPAAVDLPTKSSQDKPINLTSSIAAVVNIETEHLVAKSQLSGDARGSPVPEIERRFGSGFFISKNGLIVTNAHVVSGAKTVVIRNQDGNEALGHVLGLDPVIDIAVIQTSMHSRDVISLDTASTPEIGEPVYAIGSSFGLPHSVTYGIVSALHRSISNPIQDFIQTDSAINQGNSGGPLISKHGALVGVNTMIIGVRGGNNGVGFAIPTEIVRNIAQQIVDYGDVKPGQIGVHVQNVSADMAEALGHPHSHGVVATNIVPGTTVERLGLRNKDIVTRIDEQPIISAAQIAALVYSKRVGSELSIVVLRENEEIKLTADIIAPQKSSTRHSSRLLDGLSFTEFRGINTTGERIEGLGIIEVVPGSPGWLAGLMPHDLIVQIGSTKIKSLADLDDIQLNRPTLIEIVRQNSPALLVLSPQTE